MTDSSAAHAEQGEGAWTLGGTVPIFTHPTDDASLSRVAILGDLGLRYALDDFWELGAVVHGGIGLGGDQRPEGIGHALVETRYTIDALTWVPFLSAGLGCLIRSDGPASWRGVSGPRVDLTGHLGFGVEYRPERTWSLGLVARFHGVFTDIQDTIGPFGISMSWSGYWD